MNDAGDSLTQLRDLHIEAVSWWPPAWGWWAVMMTVFVVVITVVIWLRRRRWRRAALRALRDLEMQWRADGDVRRYSSEVSVLLRRVALARFARAEVAALVDERWLQFLDRSGRMDEFYSAGGRVMCAAPYVSAPAVDAAALTRIARRWIKRVR